MKAEEKYSAGIMAQAFWLIEFKKVVQLIEEGKSRDEIKRMSVEENLFGAPNPYRTERMFGYLYNRAAAMDEELRKLFLSSDVGTQKVINLICVLSQDRLFFEFVYEVYREKAYLGIETLTVGDINIFFHEKSLQDEGLANWTDPTLKRVNADYRKFLTEVGMLRPMSKNEYTISPLFLDYGVEQYLTSTGKTAMLKALTGVM